MEPLLLIQDDELTVLVRLLQHMLALFDVAVIVLQAQQGGHQGHVGLQRGRTSAQVLPGDLPLPAKACFRQEGQGFNKSRDSKQPIFRTTGGGFYSTMIFYVFSWFGGQGGRRYFLGGNTVHTTPLTPILPEKASPL